MRTSLKLEKGDPIALCATARFVDQSTIDEASKFLQNSGYDVILADNLNKRHHQMAGTDSDRLKAFQKLIDSHKVKAIWCLRGGFGSLRIIDEINFKQLRIHPKILIGFSDFTSILNHIVNLDYIGVHGPMPIQLTNLTELAKDSFWDIVEGNEISYEWASNNFNQIGKGTGKLVGGNLSVLYSLIGSSSFPKLYGAILFLEDLDEYLYHIDRMILAIKRTGAFQGLKGIVLGSFTDLHDHQIPFGQGIEEIILEHFGDLNIPIAFNFPAGHQDDNRCLLLGEVAQMNVTNEQSTLK